MAASAGVDRYDSRLLRGDAWGHGVSAVSEVLRDAGFVRNDPEDDTHAPPSDDRVLDAVALFGLTGAPQGTAPVMSLRGAVLATKTLRVGEGVSYGYLFRAAIDTRIALVTGGYAQGVVRSLGNAADVALAGRRLPIIGRVAMDVCVVDIADAEAQRGDDVVFFGDPARGEPSLTQWRDATGFSEAELVTAVGLHANRKVVE
ncbi:alanine racemase C-terminal domain-containing protein [Microbacterium sp. P07]|uniref:alanine racemase C-terminal domain-containing protein n=1 Tax=Microbacterium sp. P07 TaxID=3366952 RepID=UPI0037462FAB